MANETEKTEPPTNGKSRRFSKDTLNLIIAVSAVLISAASFVAAYIQSDAALRQVKAETWPFLQIETGNVRPDFNSRSLYFRVANVGVGPAKIHSFILSYEGQPVGSLPAFVERCCRAEPTESAEDTGPPPKYNSTTNKLAPTILPVGGDVYLFSVPEEGNDPVFWNKLDRARHTLKATSCYCSLLGDCFETDFDAEPVEVEACERNRELDYVG